MSQLIKKAAEAVHSNTSKTLLALSRLDSALALDSPPTAEQWATWVETCRAIAAEAKSAAGEACDWSEAMVADTR